MNFPTLFVLLLVAAATALALWLPRRHGRKLTDCGCNTASRSTGADCGCNTASRPPGTGCQGCALADHCRERGIRR